MAEIAVALTPTTPRLPQKNEAGVMGEWELPVGDGGDTLDVVGRFLGVGSSGRHEHTNHDGRHASAGVRCRACRWFEARIFRCGEDADGDYVVYNVGQSSVPGETPRYSLRRLATAAEVVDLLTTRRGDGNATISLPAEIVLSAASRHDHGIHEAYVNRALA